MHGHEEYRTEPLVQRKLGVLEYRALQDGERGAALTAFEASVASSVRVYAAAVRAGDNTVGVYLLLDEPEARRFVAEISENLR